MPSKRQIEQATDLEEALRLSAQEGAALVENDDEDDGDDDSSEDGYFPESPAYGDDDEDDPDIADLNDPDVQSFEDVPQIGSRSQRSDLFGSGADTFGRATSPKLYAQAANFPTAVQYRVWRWENGIPVALGAIDAEATEEDMVRKFYEAMPRKGDGRFQFRFRPVDIRGKELGKEFTLNFSEHHAEVVRIRRQKEDEREERGVGDPILINQGNDSGAQYAEEMGRMFEQAVEASERRTELLQQTLEDERNRLREEEKARYQERIQVADRSATVVQQMTDKLMQTDRARSEEQVKAQREQGQMLLSTLTTVFSQQQESSRVQSERFREADASRMEQDRAYFERQRMDSEERRKVDSQEWERKRIQEREESENRVRSERDRLALEATRIQEQRKFELEQMRIDAEKRQKEDDSRRERERMELESRRIAEREEWERKRIQEREDAERRERGDRERIDRERQDFQLRMERERQEAESRESRRREEMQRESDRRREEMSLQQKQIEMTAQRDREHAERLAEAARIEREHRDQLQLRRDQMEREAKEFSEKERQRQHDMQVREMEMAEQRRQQHDERMLQLKSAQNSGGISGLVETLGMEAPELLGRIFGGGEGGDDGGWASAVPKVLGSIAELGKAAMTAKQEAGKDAVHGRRRISGQPGQIVQTAQGPVMLMPQGPQGIPVVPQVQRPVSPVLPNESFVPEEFDDFEDFDEEEEESPVPSTEPEGGKKKPQATDHGEESDSEEPVDTMSRAKEAGISLPVQKKARKAIRSLVDALDQSEEDVWTGLITEAITSEVGIYYYIKAVTVQAALLEAGASSDLCAQVMLALRESDLIPEAVPYDEVDYSKLAASTEGGEG